MELERAGLIFERNFRKAQEELTQFSNKIAEITDAHAKRKFGFSKEKTNTPFYRYWETIQRSTDSKERRRIRTDIVKEILRRAFDKQKDRNRFFSIAQKEQVWAKSKDKKCCHPHCKHKAPLRWETATIDHIIPYALGGPTDVSNAQLMCRRHNSMKRDKQNFAKFFISQKLKQIP